MRNVCFCLLLAWPSALAAQVTTLPSATSTATPSAIPLADTSGHISWDWLNPATPVFSSLVIDDGGSTAGCVRIYGTDHTTYSAICASNAGTALSGPGLGYELPTGNAVGALTMATSTTYYMGWPGTAMNTTAGTHRVFFLRPGTVKIAQGSCTATNTPSNEAQTLYLRLNNTTDNLISNALSFSGSTVTWSNSALAVAVNVGDYGELKWVTPGAWTTPATNPGCQGFLYVE